MGVAVVFINEKGGIGKTSACFNAAWELSNRKFKVLLLDMDGQKANLTYFCGIKKEDDMHTMFDVLNSGKKIPDVCVEVKENLYLVPATVTLAGLSQTAKITRMKKAILEVKDDYDYIFIDVNPTPNWSHVLALSAADYAIIPMLPDVTSLEANTGIRESIEEVQGSTNPNLKVMGLLFNRVRYWKNTFATNLSKEVVRTADLMAEGLGTHVFNARIREAVALGENVASHIGVTEYAPKSKAANDVNEFVDEILKETK